MVVQPCLFIPSAAALGKNAGILFGGGGSMSAKEMLRMECVNSVK